MNRANAEFFHKFRGPERDKSDRPVGAAIRNYEMFSVNNRTAGVYHIGDITGPFPFSRGNQGLGESADYTGGVRGVQQQRSDGVTPQGTYPMG
jgi:hypothetical protein